MLAQPSRSRKFSMSHSEISWYRRIRWLPATTLIILPLIFLCLVPYVRTTLRVIWFAVAYGFHSGLCITAGMCWSCAAGHFRVDGSLKYTMAGYHRLWSHRSYSASRPLRLYLAVFGAAAMEGPIIWWAREHRAHHRYTDTEEDPYNIKKGLLHAHLLWMVLERPRRRRHIDISDLKADRIVMWQSRHFPILAVLMGWIFPTVVIGLLFEDWLGGFFYGAIGKMFWVHQGTFCINSLAHYLGERPYDDRATPRDSFLVAMITLGEGYHNFHHTFPSDYRNGIRWYHYDCTKWVIALWEKAGLAYNLKRVEWSEIERAHLQELQKKLESQIESLPQGKPLHCLPMIDWTEYQWLVMNGTALIAVEDVVHDVGGFIAEHPGGSRLIQGFVGKDATAAFKTGIYSHSKVARNILVLTRVALLRKGPKGEGGKDVGLSGQVLRRS